MNLNIRQTVVHNVKDNNIEQLQDTIVDSIQREEEQLLPGLGVLFEIIWKQSSEQDQQQMLQKLESGLKH
ncbi:small acid-soluble spore protein SspI [Jeotgalibacillus haloalkalitolerans]|uniref:Small, acid-soluble spore protein I n=1 Tax=Jeotgalibacillus haloalkalitolerans TaxID=3104292 RepID=A0ABU5KMC8_9BACL|nr:small acid-soluble spore protein SspI [Jeotgalibacillus sp. HH7-29]MDZ5712419.1 small acid-soluble spore protein SspI [Jeotgalibacillus sp. HH7-29]